MPLDERPTVIRGAPSRLAPARRRAALARTALAAGSVVVFAAAGALARVQFAGHRKQSVSPLRAPGPFVSVVRENQLQAGILAPAEAPPEAVSAPS